MAAALWERMAGAWQLLLATGDGPVLTVDGEHTRIQVCCTGPTVHWIRVTDDPRGATWHRDNVDPGMSAAPGRLIARLRTIPEPAIAIQISLRDEAENALGELYVILEDSPVPALAQILLTGPAADRTAEAMGAQ